MVLLFAIIAPNKVTQQVQIAPNGNPAVLLREWTRVGREWIMKMQREYSVSIFRERIKRPDDE